MARAVGNKAGATRPKMKPDTKKLSQQQERDLDIEIDDAHGFVRKQGGTDALFKLRFQSTE